MSNQSLLGKRVLVTQADMFMGPVLCLPGLRRLGGALARAAPNPSLNRTLR